MKVCPVCGTENPDDAKVCMKCGYVFPSVPPSQPPYAPPPSPPSSSKKPILIGVIATVAVVIIILGVLFIPSSSSKNSGFSGVASALASSASNDYGGNWYAEPNGTGSAVVYSNGSAKVTFLNGSSTMISIQQAFHSSSSFSLSPSEFIGSTMEIITLKEKSTNNNLTIVSIVFSNKTEASTFYLQFAFVIEFGAAFANITVQNITYNGYSILYFPGGTISEYGYTTTVGGFALAINNNHVILITSGGVELKQSFVDSVISTLG